MLTVDGHVAYGIVDFAASNLYVRAILILLFFYFLFIFLPRTPGSIYVPSEWMSRTGAESSLRDRSWLTEPHIP